MCLIKLSSFALFFAIFFFFLHVLLELLLTIWNTINYFLDVLISISLFLIHILHLMSSSHLLLFHHLLLLDGCSVLFLSHLILLLIILGSILNDVSIFTYIDRHITRSVWLTISWWWNILPFVSIIEFSALCQKTSFEILFRILITDNNHVSLLNQRGM